MCNGTVREMKKQKILDAAYHLFMKNGYSNTKIIDIAEAAGIGKGTVYEYFESKETLLLSIISEGIEDYLKECSSVTDAVTKEADKLGELIRLEAKHIQQNGIRIMKMSQLIIDNGMPENFINQMRAFWDKKFCLVKDILDTGIKKGEFRDFNTELAAIVIMGAVSGYLSIKYGVPQLDDVELPFNVEAFEQKELMEMVLGGIRA